MRIYILILLGGFVMCYSCGSDDPQFTSPEPRELTIPTEGYTTPSTYAGMELLWGDEFNGSELNDSDWNFEIGTGVNGWGNFEEQYYREENTSIVEGNLVIEGKRENFNGKSYTSSRLSTQSKQEFQYGRIDVRAAVPGGTGMWPAIWMLGSDFSTVGWPKCGEIDIMEVFGARGNNKVYGTVHWDQEGSYANYGGTTTLTSEDLSSEYHVYSIEWTEDYIRWYVDDREFHVIDITPAELSEFRQKYFLIINLAIGGDKGAGNPSSLIFPRWLIIDYVRVFQPI